MNIVDDAWRVLGVILRRFVVLPAAVATLAPTLCWSCFPALFAFVYVTGRPNSGQTLAMNLALSLLFWALPGALILLLIWNRVERARTAPKFVEAATRRLEAVRAAIDERRERGEEPGAFVLAYETAPEGRYDRTIVLLPRQEPVEYKGAAIVAAPQSPWKGAFKRQTVALLADGSIVTISGLARVELLYDRISARRGELRRSLVWSLFAAPTLFFLAILHWRYAVGGVGHGPDVLNLAACFSGSVCLWIYAGYWLVNVVDLTGLAIGRLRGRNSLPLSTMVALLVPTFVAVGIALAVAIFAASA